MSVTNRRIVYLLLLAIMLLASFFRFWRLDDFPPGLYHDEAYNGLDALSLVNGEAFPQFYEGWELYAADAHAAHPPQETHFPVFFEGNYGREPLHVYLMALSISLFGSTPFAVRAVPAAAGVLAVLTTFLAARALLDQVEERGRREFTALLAAFVVAVLYPAVHFSRFGIRAMLFVPVETMAVACFWWALNRRRAANTAMGQSGAALLFVAAGALLGLGVYTFAAARLLPLVWMTFVPLWFLQERGAWKQYWRHVAGMALAALVTALPLLLFFYRYPYYFIFRISYVANKGKGAVEGKPWLTWLLNIGRVFRGLIWYGETHLRHNLPGRPYMDLVQVILFLLGLLAALRRIVLLPLQFLLIWFGVMLLPSIMSGDAPHFGRLSGAVAPLAILVALGGSWLGGKVSMLLKRRFAPVFAERAALVLIILLLASSAVWASIDYFWRYARQPELTTDFYLADWQLGQYARQQGQDSELYLTPTKEELATILFALQDPDRLRNYNGADGLIPAGQEGVSSLYLLGASDTASMDALQRYFPEGSSSTVNAAYLAFAVPADVPRNRLEQSADVMFADKIALVGWRVEQTDDLLDVTLAWQAQDNLELAYTAFVHLIDAQGNVLTQQDRPPAGYPTSDWRPGEIVVDKFTLTLPGDLPPESSTKLITGFYYLPTLDRLGEAAVLEDEGQAGRP